jgi:putative NADH-flavin reductase
MKIAVIGSTRGTGLEVIKQGIEKGHFITALARHPEKLEGIRGIGAVVKGDALNMGDIRRTVEGQDAVISILGTPEPASNIISSMKEAKIKRVIWVSAWPIAGTKPWFLIKLSWLMFRAHYIKLVAMERMVATSDLDWTIVRPPRLTNGKKIGKVRIERGDDISSGPYSITRADLAAVLLEEAESPINLRKAIVVTALPKKSNKPAADLTLLDKGKTPV